MEFLFWQTSDPINYLPMIELTSNHNAAYCKAQNIKYEKFVGIYRGFHPWQATFNRITKIKHLFDDGFRGWFLYMDADAYVFDTGFNVKQYLRDNDQYVLIAATGGDGRRLAVNAGVLFINMAHCEASYIVNKWYDLFKTEVSDEHLIKQSAWDDTLNDQELLHRLLGQREQELSPVVLVDDGGLINYRGSFIRQVLRSSVGGLDGRLKAIKEDLRLSSELFADRPVSD